VLSATQAGWAADLIRNAGADDVVVVAVGSI
jgi:hypothetical protein